MNFASCYLPHLFKKDGKLMASQNYSPALTYYNSIILNSQSSTIFSCSITSICCICLILSPSQQESLFQSHNLAMPKSHENESWVAKEDKIKERPKTSINLKCWQVAFVSCSSQCHAKPTAVQILEFSTHTIPVASAVTVAQGKVFRVLLYRILGCSKKFR